MLLRNQAKCLQRVSYRYKSDCKKYLRNEDARWGTGQSMKISSDHTFISHMQALERLQKRALLWKEKSLCNVTKLLFSLWSCNLD